MEKLVAIVQKPGYLTPPDFEQLRRAEYDLGGIPGVSRRFINGYTTFWLWEPSSSRAQQGSLAQLTAGLLEVEENLPGVIVHHRDHLPDDPDVLQLFTIIAAEER